jgi:transcriptional regulator with XRE-family HTH domain
MPTKPNQALIYRRVPAFLRELRERAGLTQRQLAARVGQTQWWVARSETGSRRLDVAEFVEFCVGCGTEPAEALTELTKRRR